MIGLGLRITSGAAHNALPGIAAPALTLTGGTVDAPLLPQLNTGTFTLEHGAMDTHASTDWQIATDAAFTNVVWSAPGSLGLTQITIGLALNETSTYYARARHNGANYQSKYNAAVMFNTLTVSVATPAITSPAAAAIGMGETPTMTSSPFTVTNGTDVHASTDWQIAADAGFTAIVAQSLADATNQESWAVPAGNLLVNTGYFVRVRHTGAVQGTSAWSLAINFTTAATFGWGPISGASYDAVSFSVAIQDGQPTEVAFSSDGTKMYVVGITSDTVYQYSLSTAWDLSTAFYASKSVSVSTQSTEPRGVTFSSDGTRMYITSISPSDTIYQYALTIAWDLATASYASKSLLVTSQASLPASVQFNDIGTKMYVADLGSDGIYQYTLTTAWDLSTASYASKSFSAASQDTAVTSLAFKTDGTKMYVAGQVNDTVYQYSLSTAWDVSTASYDTNSFSVGTQDGKPTGIAFKSDGTRLYLCGDFNNKVYQYSF
ncbi:MAG: hypothetical protein COA85_04935 [Robiginitomaculum sp.]|nr:MAG: hypothetical protein COA85_04935 [Robiginitomaculum sp.]